MIRHLAILLLALLCLQGCNNSHDTPSEKNLEKAVIEAHEIFEGDDHEALADLYVIPPGQSHEDNLRYAQAIQNIETPTEYEIHDSRVSGNLGVAMVSSSGTDVASPLYARWQDGRWLFFRSLVLWGNTNRLEYFGLSESEMKHAQELQSWVTSKQKQGEQGAAPNP